MGAAGPGRHIFPAVGGTMSAEGGTMTIEGGFMTSANWRIWGGGGHQGQMLMPLMPCEQGRRHGFLSGGVESSAGWPIYPKIPEKSEKTPDFSHFILESGGSKPPVFKSARVAGQDLPPPDPPVGDAPACEHQNRGPWALKAEDACLLFIAFLKNKCGLGVFTKPKQGEQTIDLSHNS